MNLPRQGASRNDDKGKTVPRPSNTDNDVSLAPHNWPDMFPLPVNTQPWRATEWYNFVPRYVRNSQRLIDAAHGGDDGARTWVTDLIRQMQQDGHLTASHGMMNLLISWMTNPTSSSMFDEWVAWYAQNPSQVHWAVRHLNDNCLEAPLHQDLEAMWLAHCMAPIIPPDVPATAHNMFIEHTAELFSIPGLYAWIIQVGHYPVANNNEPAPFPRSFAQNSSIYDVVRWYAACEFHPMWIGFLEEFHCRHHNYILRRVLEDVTLFEGHFPVDLRDGCTRPPSDPEPPTPGAGNAPAGSSQLGPNPGVTPEAGDPDHDMGGH
ncbi:hypothetical protein SCP_0306720 [Sparassis crispa]|uniref:Uncharacterized protein n=1 Tax=Sparassis crispa TaxID=139825 RepID=A0A401GFL1_9APHY|nr:hypothetical protein SCP_0306720 [Sparassis crispa]GBE80949.1 hypothetical protein SCP_0306720 [Sparassis crispa]